MSIPTLTEVQRGLRIDDDPLNVARFRVRCPEHGVLAADLSIGEARALQDAHRSEHELAARTPATVAAGLPQ